MPRRDALEHFHDEHLVIGGDVGSLEDGGQFKLAGGHFVVAGLDGDAESIQLSLGFAHKGHDAGGNRTEVMVLKLLALGGAGAKEGALAGDQVLALEVILLVDQEVLLLGSGGGHDAGHAGGVAEDLQNAHGLLADGVHRTEQGRLVVEGFTGPRNEGGRDAEGDCASVAGEEDGARAIPSGVTAGLEGGANAAGGEAGSIGLALHEG